MKTDLRNHILFILDILAVFSLLYLLGHIFNGDNPLFVNMYASPYVFAQLLLSLFYSFKGGLIFLTLHTVASFFTQIKPDTEFLLWNTLLTLTACEFSYIWRRKNKEKEKEIESLKMMVDKLRSDLHFLKISHDQLEIDFLINPRNIRNILADIRKDLPKEKDERRIAKLLFNILNKYFQITDACLIRYKGGKYEVIEGERKGINFNDPLLKKAVHEGESIFLTPKDVKEDIIEGKELSCLAVFVYKYEDCLYLLTVKEMPFENMNEEVLREINILFNYLVEDIVYSKKLREFIKNNNNLCSFEFLKELFKAQELKRNLGIDSFILLFDIADGNISQQLIAKNLRHTDLICIRKEEGKVFILCPLTSLNGAESVARRLENSFETLKLVGIKGLEDDKILENFQLKIDKDKAKL